MRASACHPHLSQGTNSLCPKMSIIAHKLGTARLTQTRCGMHGSTHHTLSEDNYVGEMHSDQAVCVCIEIIIVVVMQLLNL